MTNNIPVNTTTNLVALGKETLNDVIIDILHGVKEVGHDVYGASKLTIIKSVDFVTEQAPLVVQEFCTYHFWEAIINLGFLAILAGIMLFLIHKSYKYLTAPNGGEDNLFGGVLLLITLAIFSIPIIAEANTNLKMAIKIKVAPRVYVIDYVAARLQQK